MKGLFVALHAVITCTMTLAVQKANVGARNVTVPKTGKKVSVVFPGFGEPDRIDFMKDHVNWLRRQPEVSDCIIFVYKSESEFPLDSDDFDPCIIIRHVGLWMEQYKAFQPTGSPWVLAWIDSVSIDPSTSLSRMIRVAEANQIDHLGVGAHAFSGAETLTKNRNGRNGTKVGREYHAPDFQFDLFRADAFQCLQSIIDTDINPLGWGVDMVFQWACNVKQGLWDEVAWSHVSRGSYDHGPATHGKSLYFSKFESLGWSFEERHPIGELEDPDKK